MEVGRFDPPDLSGRDALDPECRGTEDRRMGAKRQSKFAEILAGRILARYGWPRTWAKQLGMASRT